MFGVQDFFYFRAGGIPIEAMAMDHEEFITATFLGRTEGGRKTGRDGEIWKEMRLKPIIFFDKIIIY